jgi:hypothetical protein
MLMKINNPKIVVEIETAFARYDAALLREDRLTTDVRRSVSRSAAGPTKGASGRRERTDRR